MCPQFLHHTALEIKKAKEVRRGLIKTKAEEKKGLIRERQEFSF